LLAEVGVAGSDAEIKTLVDALKGKTLSEVIAEGMKKVGSLSFGGCIKTCLFIKHHQHQQVHPPLKPQPQQQNKKHQNQLKKHLNPKKTWIWVDCSIDLTQYIYYVMKFIFFLNDSLSFFPFLLVHVTKWRNPNDKLEYHSLLIY
jgi:ribosomal protein L12E/L44/L45/RPP1/RPP2